MEEKLVDVQDERDSLHVKLTIIQREIDELREENGAIFTKMQQFQFGAPSSLAPVAP